MGRIVFHHKNHCVLCFFRQLDKQSTDFGNFLLKKQGFVMESVAFHQKNRWAPPAAFSDGTAFKKNWVRHGNLGI